MLCFVVTNSMFSLVFGAFFLGGGGGGGMWEEVFIKKLTLKNKTTNLFCFRTLAVILVSDLFFN